MTISNACIGINMIRKILTKLTPVLLLVIYMFISLNYDYSRIKFSYYLAKANRAFERGESQVALLNYRLAMEIDLTNLILALKYGDLLSEEGRFKESLNHYHRSVRLIPSSDIEFRLGNLHKRNSEMDSSVYHFYRAHYLSPSKFRPLYAIVKVYYEQDKIKEADSVARIIVNKKIKIKSPEVILIREEMRLLLKEISKQQKSNNDNDYFILE